ncbi:hypothetical protein HMPREF0290_2359 [Corynebacterium efficiens YS-314]|nr:hypothetical protein HMPREF0290_2359 [Corynebacterium efficiens YS-314]
MHVYDRKAADTRQRCHATSMNEIGRHAGAHLRRTVHRAFRRTTHPQALA